MSSNAFRKNLKSLALLFSAGVFFTGKLSLAQAPASLDFMEVQSQRMEAAMNHRFRHFTVKNGDLPLALLVLSQKAGFNIGLEPLPEDDLAFGAGHEPHRVSVDLKNVTTNDILAALRTQVLLLYHWDWDVPTTTLNVMPVELSASADWSATKIPDFSLENACYSEGVEKVLALPPLKGSPVVFIPNGFVDAPCNNKVNPTGFTFRDEEDDPIRLNLRSRKDWTVRQWLNLMHKKISRKSVHSWIAIPQKTEGGSYRYEVGPINGYVTRPEITISVEEDK